MIFLICSLFSLASFANNKKKRIATSQVDTPVAQCPSKERSTAQKVITSTVKPIKNNSPKNSATKDAQD